MPEPATQSVVVQPQPAASSLNANIGVIAEYAVAFAAIATFLAILYKLLTREVNRDVADVRGKVGAVDHRVRGVASRVDALEHLRTADVERIVRVESAVTGIKETTGRIEQTLDKNFTELAASIREIRHVAPRGGL